MIMTGKDKRLEESLKDLFGGKVKTLCKGVHVESVEEHQIFREVFHGFSSFGSCSHSNIVQGVVPDVNEGKGVQNACNRGRKLLCCIVESSYQSINSVCLPVYHESSDFLDSVGHNVHTDTVGRKASGDGKEISDIKSCKTPCSWQNSEPEDTRNSGSSNCRHSGFDSVEIGPNVYKSSISYTEHGATNENGHHGDFPARLRIYACDTLLRLGFCVEARKRKDGKIDHVYRFPDRPAMNSFPRAWVECGSILRATSLASRIKKYTRQWAGADAFFQDLSGTLAYLDKNFHHPSSPLSVMQCWQILNPFVIVVFIDHKVRVLREGKGVKVVDDRAFAFDESNMLENIIENQFHVTDDGICNSDRIKMERAATAESNCSYIPDSSSLDAAAREKNNAFHIAGNMSSKSIVLCLFVPNISKYKFNSRGPNRKCILGKELHRRRLKHLARIIGSSGSPADKFLQHIKCRGTSTAWNWENKPSRANGRRSRNPSVQRRSIGSFPSGNQVLGPVKLRKIEEGDGSFSGTQLKTSVSGACSFYQENVDAVSQKVVQCSLVSKDEILSTNEMCKLPAKVSEGIQKPAIASSPLGIISAKRVRRKSRKIAEIETVGGSGPTKKFTSLSNINFDKILYPEIANNNPEVANVIENKVVSQHACMEKPPTDLYSPLKLLKYGKMATSFTPNAQLIPEVPKRRGRPSSNTVQLNRTSMPDGCMLKNSLLKTTEKAATSLEFTCRKFTTQVKTSGIPSSDSRCNLQGDAIASDNQTSRKVQIDSYSEGSSCLASDDSQTPVGRQGGIKPKKSVIMKENQQKKLWLRINDDELLVASIFRSRNLISNKKCAPMKLCPRPTTSKKHKGQIGKCRLVVRVPGNDGSHAVDCNNFLTGARTCLAWLLDHGCLSSKDSIHFCSSKDNSIIKEGWITRDGIICKCCSTLFCLSKFKLHAGYNFSRPSSNLFLGSGTPFAVCQLRAWSAEYRSRKVGMQGNETEEVDQNDDTCGLCGDGGDLVCCDGCPSTFHHECLLAEDLPEGNWYCWSCTCQICGKALFSEEISKPLLNLECAQCHHKYHTSCLCRERFTDEEASTVWFCSPDCQKVYLSLQSYVGVPKAITDDFFWTMLRSSHVDPKAQSAQKISFAAECNIKLAIALAIMEESFLPMVDPRTRIDMIPHLLYNGGSRFARLNYEDFFTVVLEKDDALISVASIRIHGATIAEIPLVATCSEHRRKGMCRRLLGAIEEMLKSLKVKLLILTAIPSLVDTWTTGFGFEPIKEEDKQQLSKINLMLFPGTLLLKKTLYESNECEKNGAVEDASSQDSLQKGHEYEDPPCGSPLLSTRNAESVNSTGCNAEIPRQISNGENTGNISSCLKETSTERICRGSSGLDNGLYVDVKTKVSSINKVSRKRKLMYRNSCGYLIKENKRKNKRQNACHPDSNFFLELPDLSKLTLNEDRSSIAVNCFVD